MISSSNLKLKEESGSKVPNKENPKKHLKKIRPHTKPKQAKQPLAKEKHKVVESPAFSRPLFTDGFNSFSHFTLGVLSVYYKVLVPICTLYQLLDPNDVNMYVDILEFIIGYTVGLLFSKA